MDNNLSITSGQIFPNLPFAATQKTLNDYIRKFNDKSFKSSIRADQIAYANNFQNEIFKFNSTLEDLIKQIVEVNESKTMSDDNWNALTSLRIRLLDFEYLAIQNLEKYPNDDILKFISGNVFKCVDKILCEFQKKCQNNQNKSFEKRYRDNIFQQFCEAPLDDAFIIYFLNNVLSADSEGQYNNYIMILQKICHHVAFHSNNPKALHLALHYQKVLLDFCRDQNDLFDGLVELNTPLDYQKELYTYYILLIRNVSISTFYPPEGELNIIEVLNFLTVESEKEKDLIKSSTLKFHCACLYLEINDLRKAYEILIKLSEVNLPQPNLIEIKLKLSEIYQQYIKLSNETNVEKFVKLQREYLLAAALDQKLNIDKKIKARFSLAMTYLETKFLDHDSHVLLQKSLEFVINNAKPTSIYLPLAHFHLGMLLILGAKGIPNDLKLGLEYLNKAENSIFATDKMVKKCQKLKIMLMNVKHDEVKSNDFSKEIQKFRKLFTIGVYIYLSNDINSMNWFINTFAMDYRNYFMQKGSNHINVLVKDFELTETQLVNKALPFHLNLQKSDELNINEIIKEYKSVFENLYNFFSVKLKSTNFQLSNEFQDAYQFMLIYDVDGVMEPAVLIKDMDHLENILLEYSNDAEICVPTFLHENWIKNLTPFIKSVEIKGHVEIRTLGIVENILSKLKDIPRSLAKTGVKNAYLMKLNFKWVESVGAILKIIHEGADYFSNTELKNTSSQRLLLETINIQKLYLRNSKFFNLENSEFSLLPSHRHVSMLFLYRRLVSILPEKQKVELLLHLAKYIRSKSENDISLAILSIETFMDALFVRLGFPNEKSMLYKELDIVKEIVEIWNLYTPEILINYTNEDHHRLYSLIFLMTISIQYFRFIGNDVKADELAAILKKRCKVTLEGEELDIQQVFDTRPTSLIDIYETRKFNPKKIDKNQLYKFLSPDPEISLDFLYSNNCKQAIKNRGFSITNNAPTFQHESEMPNKSIKTSEEDFSISATSEIRKNTQIELSKGKRKQELKENRVGKPAIINQQTNQVTTEMDPQIAEPQFYVEIPKSSLLTFNKLFVWRDFKKSECQHVNFDPKDFLDDIRISRDEVATLITDLGGKYIDGKGSHTRGMLRSIEDSDKIIFKSGETMTFTNLDFLQPNKPSSQSFTFSKNFSYDPRQISQLRRKFLILGYNPNTVKQEKK